LNFYNNSATDLWAIKLDDFKYDDLPLDLAYEYEIWTDLEPRIAYIDSGNTSI